MEYDFESKYRALFRRHYAALLFYATRIVGEDDAADVVQDVFFDLWRRQDEVELGDQIQAFLYRAVYTKALNILKHRAVTENYSAVEAEFYSHRLDYYQPEHAEVIRRMESQELRAEITRAINELPEKCREVFKMSYLHDMKNKDIADVLGLSLRTVEAHMYKALKTLRERLHYLRLLILLLGLH